MLSLPIVSIMRHDRFDGLVDFYYTINHEYFLQTEQYYRDSKSRSNQHCYVLPANKEHCDDHEHFKGIKCQGKGQPKHQVVVGVSAERYQQIARSHQERAQYYLQCYKGKKYTKKKLITKEAEFSLKMNFFKSNRSYL